MLSAAPVGAAVVQYKYDAWGNHKVLDANGAEITDTEHIGHRNPFRYRGYFYETVAGLYYLKSRFYDPETGRFLTPDSVEYLDPETIGGLNFYAYCNNNPVMNVDPDGHLVIALSTLAIIAAVGAGVGAVAGGISGGIIANSTGQSIWGGIILGVLAGAIMGAGAAVGTTLMAPLLGISASITLSAGSMSISLGAFSAFGLGAAIAFGTGALGGAIAEAGGQYINNGSIANRSAVGQAALGWGFLNVTSAVLGAFGEGRTILLTDTITTKILPLILGNITTSVPISILGLGMDYTRSIP